MGLYRQTTSSFGRDFRYLSSRALKTLESEGLADKDPASYLALTDLFGERRINAQAREILTGLIQKEDFDINELSRSNESALQYVSQAMMTNLVDRVARQARISPLPISHEEITDNFKQALIALQTGSRRGFYKASDQISIMLQLGRVPTAVVRENQELIRETLGALFDNVIPKSQQIGAIEEAFQARRI